MKKSVYKLELFFKLIIFKFSVASISDCPPDKKAIPGTSSGTLSNKHFNVNSAIFSELIFQLNLFRKYHIWF